MKSLKQFVVSLDIYQKTFKRDLTVLWAFPDAPDQVQLIIYMDVYLHKTNYALTLSFQESCILIRQDDLWK